MALPVGVRILECLSRDHGVVVSHALPDMNAASQSVSSSGGQLLGRDRERAVLDRLLAGVRGGSGAVLVMHGDAGVGKTALLGYAADAAREFRIAQASGVQAEMELPFAAVEQLCAPFIDFLDRLAKPQRDALGVAFGRTAGAAPNPFLIGLAVLGLLSEAAEKQPLLAVVDDAAVTFARPMGLASAGSVSTVVLLEK